MPKRKLDIAWLHCTEVEENKKKVKCNYCSKVVGGITRLKQQLASVGKDGTGCPEVPSQVSQNMRNNLLQVQQNVAQNAEIQEGGHQALALPQVKIAFKGVIGACSEEAALSVYPHCKMDPCETFEEALKAVESLEADKAIIPIENSLGGSFHENYHLIYSHQLHIVGEFEASMNFCLLARPDIRMEQLERVLGHSQALEQTKTFLRKLGVEKDIVADDRYYARDENAKEGITPFWILGRDPIVPTKDKSFKTSLVFTLKEGPKELYKALSVFSMREITLTKVESRPQRNILPHGADSWVKETAECFKYLFYIDFEASMEESRVECAVRHLKEFATYMRILGSYPLIEVSRTA